jgi:hypothetical protein
VSDQARVIESKLMPDSKKPLVSAAPHLPLFRRNGLILAATLRTLMLEELLMDAYAPPADEFTRHAEEWIGAIGAEFRRAATYVDAEIVPEVRRDAGAALRELAGLLDHWANQLDPQPVAQSQPHRQ